MTYLDKILEEKKREVAQLHKEKPAQRYQEQAHSLDAIRDFRGAITRAKRTNHCVKLLAEIKKASPSRGLIVQDFDPVVMAQRYLELGASAFSVLTDRLFFQGSIEYLQQVRRLFPLPVLRKEFIIDEAQIFESRLIGADALLLIVAALDVLQLRDYLHITADLGLHALVEVHDRKELDIALEQGATIIGVNNRNLKDFSVDLHASAALRPHIPSNVVAVAESGMKTAADIALINQAEFDAVLIGEGLHTSPELRELTWS